MLKNICKEIKCHLSTGRLDELDNIIEKNDKTCFFDCSVGIDGKGITPCCYFCEKKTSACSIVKIEDELIVIMKRQIIKNALKANGVKNE